MFDVVLFSLILLLAGGVASAIILTKGKREQINPQRQYGLPVSRDTSATEKTPDFASIMNAAAVCLNQYKFDEAMQHYQMALGLKPQEPSLHYKIGRLFLQKEEYDKAVSAFENVLKMDDGFSEATFELARTYFMKGESENAMDTLDKLIANEPNHQEALRLKVRIALNEKQPLRALTTLQMLVQGNIPFARIKEYRLMMAECYVQQNEIENAIHIFRALQDAEPSAGAFYQSKMAQLYFEAEDYDNAVAAYEVLFLKYAKDDLVNDPIVMAQKAAAHCNKGVKLFELGMLDEALKEYQQAIQLDSENLDILFNLGKAYSAKREFNFAIKYLQKCNTLNPQDEVTLYEIGIIHEETGNYAKAAEFYLQAIDLNKNYFQALFALGTLQGMRGQFKEAIQYLKRAIGINPHDVDALYNIGVAFEKIRDLKTAVKVYKQVLRISPGHVEAHSNLAHIKQELKRPVA